MCIRDSLRGQEPLLTYWLQKLGQLGRNAIVLPIVYAPFLFQGTFRRERLLVWLGFVGSVYSVFVQGTFAGYHYLPGMALGAILVGDLFSTVSRWALKRFHTLVPVDAVLAVFGIGACVLKFLNELLLFERFDRFLVGASRVLDPFDIGNGKTPARV